MGSRAYGAFVIVSVTALLVLAGCGMTSANSADNEAGTSSLSEAQATEIAEHALQGYNDSDYQAWSRNWSGAMKSAIKESDFLSFRAQQMKSLGAFVAIESTDLRVANTEGFVVWRFTVEYEKGRQILAMTFPEVGDTVEGVRVESVS